MNYTLYISLWITLWMGLSFMACSGDEVVIPGTDERVEITFRIDNYTKVVTSTRSASKAATRATDIGSTEESQIDDLYLFLFKSDGSDPVKYYISTAGDFTYNSKSGNWDKTNGKITLNMTQAEAGTRLVYIVANCADLKSNLDAVTTVSGTGTTALQTVLHTTPTPWSPTLTTPLLMSGNAMHNFIENRVLGSGGTNPKVKLTRALAKVELNITLKTEHQSKPVVKEGDFSDPNPSLTDKPQYHYAFLNFDKNTYLWKPGTKTGDLTAPAATVDLHSLSESAWVVWNTLGTYTQDSNGIVTTLKLITYINERDEEAGKPLSSIGISMPYTGPKPPPEFGPDISQIFLPKKIERNHWYVYDVEL